MKIKHYISLALLVCSFTLQAQENERNVTVEREYKPVIQDAGKISSVPEVTNAETQKANAVYNEINMPMTMGQNIQTLSAADLQLGKRRDPAASFLRIGLGNYNNNLVDFAMPVIKKADMKLDLKVNHFATFGEKDHTTTTASVDFNTFLKKLELYAGVNGGYEYFNYYGNKWNANGEKVSFDTLKTAETVLYKENNLMRFNRNPQEVPLADLQGAPTWNSVFRFSTFAGVRSGKDKSGLRYDVKLNYNRVGTHLGLAEDMIHTQAGFSNENGKNRMGLDVDLKNMFYSSDPVSGAANVWDSYSVFSMNPYYSFERDNWNVRLGVKTSFSFVYGKAFSPSPDIFAEWKAVPSWLALYGGVSGGYKVNSLGVSMNENRYLYHDLRLQDTYTPFYLYAGVKVKPVYNLLVDAFVSYKYMDNQYFYINKDYVSTAFATGHPEEATLYTNSFNVIYSDASLINFGLRANYNIRNTLNIQLKTQFNKWTTFDTERAWMKPKFETEVTGDYQISRTISLNASMYFSGERFAKLGDMEMRMKPYLDMNAGVSYNHENWLTLFARLNNMLNARYDEFYGYRAQGMNLIFGAAFAF